MFHYHVLLEEENGRRDIEEENEPEENCEDKQECMFIHPL